MVCNAWFLIPEYLCRIMKRKQLRIPQSQRKEKVKHTSTTVSQRPVELDYL